jgi:hypothetical protein
MVCDILKRHPYSLPIARATVDFFHGMGKWNESAELAVAAGGIEALVGAIRLHHTNGPIVASATSALAALADSTENVTKMVRTHERAMPSTARLTTLCRIRLTPPC